MKFTIDTEKESDGRWIAEAMEVNGAMVYGDTRADAAAKVKALALRVVADCIEHDDGPTGAFSVVVKAEREPDGQWRAEFAGIPESAARGPSRTAAKAAAKTRALQTFPSLLRRLPASARVAASRD